MKTAIFLYGFGEKIITVLKINKQIIDHLFCFYLFDVSINAFKVLKWILWQVAIKAVVL